MKVEIKKEWNEFWNNFYFNAYVDGNKVCGGHTTQENCEKEFNDKKDFILNPPPPEVVKTFEI